MLITTLVLELTMSLFRPEPTDGSMVRVFAPTSLGHLYFFSLTFEHVLALLNPVFVITTVHCDDSVLG